MDIALRDKFLTLWKKYYKNAELPITFYYTDGDGGASWASPPKGRSCLICELARVRNGNSVVYNAESVVCKGGKRSLGFTETIRPEFEYFLSCGTATMKGERYLRTPELVLEFMKNRKKLPMTGKHIVFKRWDKLSELDNPEVVIFFATPDVLSGLFTLANFDQTDPNGTFTPFGAGCASIVEHPYLEIKSERPRAVIGMFDPSARPCVPKDTLSFAVPMIKFAKMINYMEESFLITDTWTNLMKRME